MNLDEICEELHETVNKCISIEEIIIIANENKHLMRLKSPYDVKYKLLVTIIGIYIHQVNKLDILI